MVRLAGEHCPLPGLLVSPPHTGCSWENFPSPAPARRHPDANQASECVFWGNWAASGTAHTSPPAQVASPAFMRGEKGTPALSSPKSSFLLQTSGLLPSEYLSGLEKSPVLCAPKALSHGPLLG